MGEGVEADGNYPFQPTLPLRGATIRYYRYAGDVLVSTHAPLAGSDHIRHKQQPAPETVSTHAPLAGSDWWITDSATTWSVSTHAPLAGSDSRASAIRRWPMCFNPRSPCGERPSRKSRRPSPRRFNPRSPCGERRTTTPHGTKHERFQPTLPLRGATMSSCAAYTVDFEFQPTLPLRGATPCPLTLPYTSNVFQPTLPLRGATCAARDFSTHEASFNPRSPCGERPRLGAVGGRPLGVSTHAPLAGSDTRSTPSLPRRAVSTHAPLAGSDCYILLM